MSTVIDVTQPLWLVTLATVFLHHPVNSNVQNQLTVFDVCQPESKYIVADRRKVTPNTQLNYKNIVIED